MHSLEMETLQVLMKVRGKHSQFPHSKTKPTANLLSDTKLSTTHINDKREGGEVKCEGKVKASQPCTRIMCIMNPDKLTNALP